MISHHGMSTFSPWLLLRQYDRAVSDPRWEQLSSKTAELFPLATTTVQQVNQAANRALDVSVGVPLEVITTRALRGALVFMPRGTRSFMVTARMLLAQQFT